MQGRFISWTITAILLGGPLSGARADNQSQGQEMSLSSPSAVSSVTVTTGVQAASATAPSLSAEAAAAYSAQLREQFHLDSSWFACEADEDCTVAHVPCQTGLGIGKTHIAAAQRALCHGACIDACKKAQADVSTTACVAGGCITRFSTARGSEPPRAIETAQLSNAGMTYDASIRKLSKMPAEWFSCSKKKDCALAAVPCGPSFAVNKLHKKEAHATYCDEMGPCGSKARCVQSEPDVSTADCIDGQCATIFAR